MGNIKHGLIWNTLQQGGQLLIGLLATISLARILTPEDYGIYGIIILFISISEMLADSGIAGYLVKEKEVSRLDFDTLFVYNIVLSIILYVLLFFLSPVIANFYDKPQLILAIRVIGVCIVFQGLSITQQTSLIKQLKFKEIALISLSSSLLGFVVALLLALHSAGYWALIVQLCVTTILSSALFIIVNRNLPNFRFNWERFKKQFSFGINLLLGSILNTISNNIASNVVAKIFNINIGGYYTQAQKLQSYPQTLVSNVIDRTFFPIFAKNKDDRETFRYQVRMVRRAIYLVLFPLFALLIIFSRQIILIVLGSKWINCVELFQILMYASFPMIVFSLNRNILKAYGFTRQILYINIIGTLIVGIFIILSIKTKEINLMALSIVFSTIIAALYSIILVSYKANLNVIDQFKDILICSKLPVALLIINVLFPSYGVYIKILSSLCIICLDIVFSIKLDIPEYRLIYNKFHERKFF